MRCSFLLFCLLLVGCGAGQPQPPTVSLPPTPDPTPTTEGIVSINFDDDFESGFVNGLPIIDAAGFRTTQFIITHSIGNTGYITAGQMLAMQASGHEIAAHTRTHPHLSTLTVAQQQYEIDGSLTDLKNNWGIDAKVFAYPYGDYNSDTLAITQAAGFAGARTTAHGFNDASSPALKLECFVIDDGGINDINVITQGIDTAQRDGTWLILVFHRVDEPGNPISISHDIIQQIVDYLVAKKTHVFTMSEGLAKYDIKP